MRWFWIDRFVEFVSGQRAVAIKNVSLAEECLHDYYLEAHLASTIVLEGMAQTGGMLVAESTGYSARLVLGKVSRLIVHAPAQPGDTLRYEAVIENVSPEGVMLAATSHIDGELQAEAEFFLAILPDHMGRELFEPVELAKLLRILRVYEIGKTADGEPLQLPELFTSAEAEAAAQAELAP
jgi:3-hydroxyacyl-[acyl-carrier-protein] dehydratase